MNCSCPHPDPVRCFDSRWPPPTDPEGQYLVLERRGIQETQCDCGCHKPLAEATRSIA